MSSFRFLHSADIHLDSPLRGLSGQEGKAASRIRSATREALEQLVQVAIEETVDFLVIAGDLYDGDWKDFRTGLFFTTQMGRLNQAGISTYLLHGNHDAESQLTRRLTLPDNVHVFSTRKPQTFLISSLGVALHGQSFRQRDVPDNLALSYPVPSPDVFNIGVLHTGLGGMGGHANYAPCTLSELTSKGYDYWALGHVHRFEILHENPHVVFPGNLQGRHIRETGPKGACLVTVEDQHVADLVHVPCDDVRWSLLQVPLAGECNLNEVLQRIRREVETAVRTEAEGRLLAFRIILEGNSALHGQLLLSGNLLLNEARAIALGIGEEAAWVEKVVVATRPVESRNASGSREDSVDELLGFVEQAGTDRDLIDLIESDIGLLVRNMPAELRTSPEEPVLEAVLSGNHQLLLAEVMPQLTSLLTDEEG